MNIWKEFGTNAERENDGAWMWLDAEETVGLCIARAGGHNKRWEKELDKVLRQTGRGKKTVAEAKEVELKAFVRGCVTDWKGFTTPDGKPAEFSHETCIDFFRKLPDLYARAKEFAQDQSEYRDATLEEEEKNS